MKALAKRFAAGLACAGLIVCAAAHGQNARGELVEGVDVQRVGSEALISIRFSV